ncbi:hypothetical protein BURK_005347 [Burkholderia sp. SJ98]|nr:hypothetical protein BURK_005347 [Burkholderia sp. SJ98]
MTFILAVVHKDMSILAADRQGNASGTQEFTIGQTKVTVTAPKITINGIKKITLNRTKEFAIGIAGQYADHSYTSKVESSDDLRTSVEAVTNHAAHPIQLYRLDLAHGWPPQRAKTSPACPRNTCGATSVLCSRGVRRNSWTIRS